MKQSFVTMVVIFLGLLIGGCISYIAYLYVIDSGKEPQQEKEVLSQSTEIPQQIDKPSPTVEPDQESERPIGGVSDTEIKLKLYQNYSKEAFDKALH